MAEVLAALESDSDPKKKAAMASTCELLFKDISLDQAYPFKCCGITCARC